MKLSEFLKREGAYESFTDQFDFKGNLENAKEFQECDARDCILTFAVWNHTKEGRDYWQRLSSMSRIEVTENDMGHLVDLDNLCFIKKPKIKIIH